MPRFFIPLLLAGCAAPLTGSVADPADDPTSPDGEETTEQTTDDEAAPLASDALDRCAPGALVVTASWDAGLGALTGLAAFPDGTLAVAGEDGAAFVSVSVYDTLSLEPQAGIGPSGVLSAAGDTLLVGDADGFVQTIDREGARATLPNGYPTDPTVATALHPDGGLAAWASAAYAGEITTFGVPDGSVTRDLDTGLWEVSALAWLPGDGGLVAAGHYYSVARVEVLVAGEETRSWLAWEAIADGELSFLYDVAVSPDGGTLLVGGSALGADWEGEGFLAAIAIDGLGTDFYAGEAPELEVRPADHTPGTVAWTTEGSAWLSGGEDGALVRIDAGDGEVLDRVELGEAVTAMQLVGDELYATGGAGTLWRVGCGG